MSDGRRLGSLLDPRQSLGARILWILLPLGLVPLVVFWISTDRLGRRMETELRNLLTPTLTRQAEQSLSRAADLYREELDERVRELAAVLGEASRATAAALAEGPVPGAAEETFVVEPGLPIQAAEGERGRLGGRILHHQEDPTGGRVADDEVLKGGFHGRPPTRWPRRGRPAGIRRSRPVRRRGGIPCCR